VVPLTGGCSAATWPWSPAAAAFSRPTCARWRRGASIAPRRSGTAAGRVVRVHAAGLLQRRDLHPALEPGHVELEQAAVLDDLPGDGVHAIGERRQLDLLAVRIRSMSEKSVDVRTPRFWQFSL
jgi:hypothetical protein